ncbi:hypothetical protein AWJ20_2636 [Sugiyamaella lignohabitans]|uniref:Uncharacterized protein n=1 Tax=Sugiyamaella lignohabitans TaxID=796027 RepID=A0A161HXI6_9ASCO|nr:uncharacterized protein AWJ20_2636 [Sugiyamaella lignohabitans]ANB15016.1 hypothetical protein AWJ20_2636 [Sugiyamaella lignohabitans]
MMSLFLTPRALPQADWTNGSLAERTITWSTPLALNSASLEMKGGMWLAVQVGVKAPGTATITTFLPANFLSVS